MKRSEIPRFSFVIPLGEKRNASVAESIKNLDYVQKKIQVLIEKGPNPSANRNRGIKKSKGKFIIFLNGHSILEKDYLKKVDLFFKKYSWIDIVGGPQLTPKQGNFFEKISGIALTSNFGAFKVKRRYIKSKISFNPDETFLTSANLCVKRSVFEKIRGFDERLWPGEDPEMIFRAKREGYKLAYAPQLSIYNERRQNFALFCEQFFKYGVTRPKKNKINKNSPIIFTIPLLFTIYLLFFPILSLINIIFIIPLIFYILLSVIFAFYDSIKNKKFSGFFMLPFLYLFLHVSYGLGMIVGYISR